MTQLLALALLSIVTIISLSLSWELLRRAGVELSWYDSFLRDGLSSAIHAVTGVLCAGALIFSGALPTGVFLLFFAFLVIIARTDLEIMAVPTVVLRLFVASGLLASALGYTGLSIGESVSAAGAGYVMFRAVRQFYRRFRGIDGLGEADEEIVAGIGAFLGFSGLWVTIMSASIFGVTYGLVRVVGGWARAEDHIPFGPFLASGALCAHMFKPLWIRYILPF